jgi:hypothetical protein
LLYVWTFPFTFDLQVACVVHVFLNHSKIRCVRIKDRFCTLESPGGWRDSMFNFYFLDDPARHICEVQIVHQQLLTARKGLPGHVIYGRVRNACEILEKMRAGEHGSVDRAVGAVTWAVEKQINAAAISTLGFDQASVEAVECFQTDMLPLQHTETLDFAGKKMGSPQVGALSAILNPGFPLQFECCTINLAGCAAGPEGSKSIAEAIAVNGTITSVSLIVGYLLLIVWVISAQSFSIPKRITILY